MRLRRHIAFFGSVLPVLAASYACSTASDDSTASPPADGGGSADSGSTTTTESGAQTGVDSGQPATGTDSGTTPVTDSGALATESGTSPEGGNANLALSDDFESDTAGNAPDATLWTPVALKGCGGSAAYSIVVDTTQAHSGTKSVKVTGGDTCGPLMANTSAIAKLTGPDVYTRVYMRLPTEATNLTHTPMIMLGLTTTNYGNGTLDQANTLQLYPRTIGSSNVLYWQTDDNHPLPQPNTQGATSSAPVAANTWACVETHTSSAGMGTLETFLNGARVDGVSFIGGTTAVTSGVNDRWASMAWAPKNFALGWIVFSGPMVSVWYDDVAISGTRIGCN